MARILLVDDDSAIRRALSQLLIKGGHDVALAASHDEALAELSNGQPVDLCILDFWLGTDNGLKLMENIRDTKPGIPILFLSGGNETVPLEATTALAEMQGASEFLYKPIAADALLQAVSRHIT